METTDLTSLARGHGARAYRAGRMLHTAVSETLATQPELAAHVADIRAGWAAERSQRVADARETL